MLNKRLLTFTLASLGLSLFSCASVQETKLLTEHRPEFTGNFSPMSLPFSPVYKPTSAKFATSSAVSYQIDDKTKESIQISANGGLQVSLFGGSLLWVLDMTQYNIGGRTIKAELPLFRWKALVSSSGKTKEFDISSPAMESGQITFDKSKQTYQEFLESARQENRRSPAYPQELPANPVRTGDVLLTEPIADYIELYFDLVALSDSEKSEIKQWATENSFEWVLNGKTYYNAREVLLLTCDRELYFEKVFSISEVQLKGYGYQFIDTDTSQVLYKDFLLDTSAELQDGAGGARKIFVKHSVQYDAKIF